MAKQANDLDVKGFYFIADGTFNKNKYLNNIKAALKAKAKVIQYRNRTTPDRQMYEDAAKIKSLAKGVIFLINNRVDIALAVDADGVHLGSNDISYQIARKLLGKNKIIGLTVRNIKEAEIAQRVGADYIGVGPIFKTTTKPDAGQPVGTRLLKKIRRKVSIPIVAIGGINLDNAQDVISAGADAVCAVSAVQKKSDLTKEILKFQSLFNMS